MSPRRKRLCNTAKETLELIDDLSNERIQVCVDVNHFLQEKAEDGLKLLGNRVKTLHISDHDYEDEQHWMPEEGKIDWMKLISTLEEIGYTGVFWAEILAWMGADMILVPSYYLIFRKIRTQYGE